MIDHRPADLIRRLGLRPHPEGGHFREVFRSQDRVTRAGDDRSALTSIYFLLQEAECSRWHVVASDEAWHFYEGEPLELLIYDPVEDAVNSVVLGRDSAGAVSVHVVPAGYWQAARPLGKYSLVGCTVGPGFEFSDFRFVSKLLEAKAAFKGVLAPYRPLI